MWSNNIFSESVTPRLQDSPTIEPALIHSDRGTHSATVHVTCGTDSQSGGVSGRQQIEKKKTFEFND